MNDAQFALIGGIIVLILVLWLLLVFGPQWAATHKCWSSQGVAIVCPNNQTTTINATAPFTAPTTSIKLHTIYPIKPPS